MTIRFVDTFLSSTTADVMASEGSCSCGHPAGRVTDLLYTTSKGLASATAASVMREINGFVTVTHSFILSWYRRRVYPYRMSDVAETGPANL